MGLLLGAELAMQIAAQAGARDHDRADAGGRGGDAARVAARLRRDRGAAGEVPQTVERYLPGSAATPLAIFVIGLALFAAARWVARRRSARSDRDEAS
jgi:hypothetical protein